MRRQEQLAKTNQAIAERSADEAKTAKQAADAKTKELSSALAELRAETNARKQVEVEKTTLTSKLDDAIKKSPELEYRERLSSANDAIASGRLDVAANLLNECPTNVRGWEWRYLMARAGGAKDAVRAVTAEFCPLQLSFSPNGDLLVSWNAYGPERGGKAWNTVFGFKSGGYGKDGHLPNDSEAFGGGMVCRFSRDSKTLLAVSNHKGARAHSRLYSSASGALMRDLGTVSGFALDCGQAPNGDWLVVTTAIDDKELGKQGSTVFLAIKEPLTLHTIGSKRSMRLLHEALPGLDARARNYAVGMAVFSDDVTRLFIFSQKDSRTGGSNSWHELDLQTKAFRSMAPALPSNLLRAPIGSGYPQPHLSPQLGFFVACNALGFLCGRGGVLIEGVSRPDLLSVIDGPGAFTPDSKRLLVLSSQGVLRVLDPKSASPTRALLELKPFGGARTDHYASLAISPAGDRVVVSNGRSIAFYDASTDMH